MKKKRRMEQILLFLVVMLMIATDCAAAKNEYYMDRKQDCGYIGLIDVGRDQNIQVYGRSTDTSVSTQSGCTLNFRAMDSDAKLILSFVSFGMQTCDVNLYVSGDGSGTMKSYGCGDSEPQSFFASGRSITITLHKTDINNQNYNFQLSVRAKRDDRYPLPSDSNPIAVGLVIGIVGSVFGLIFIISCIGVCCFRKYRARGPTKSPYMFDPNNSKVKLDETQSHVSVGYTNESLKVGASPMSRKKLLAPSDSSDEKSDSNNRGDRPRTLNLRDNNRSNIPPPPSVPALNSYSPNERSVDVSSKKTNMLNALSSNPKFRNSFKETESEAEERARRISSSSFEKFGVAPNPQSSDENISRPSLPPVPKSPKGRRPKHAMINRNPRSSSMSSDELVKIERGRVDTDNDSDTRVNRGQGSSSSSEAGPVKVNEGTKKKANTTHSLKPDRKGPKGRKKQTQSVSSALDPEPLPRDGRDRMADAGPRPNPRTRKDRVAEMDHDSNDSFEKTGSGRYNKSKRPRKSPKSSGRGFSHRRGRSMDQIDSRPTTPTSMFGSMEDLESLPPLQRASSKNSLYASRSSLYDRRGRRRKGSYADSVVSYRDDMSVGRRSGRYDDSFSDEEDFDGYEKPISRRDRDRMYRSENDLGRGRGREIATQTLRETATQTGVDESVTVNQKLLVKKRRRSKSTSSSGTQTAAKKNGDKKSRTKTGVQEVNDEKGEKKKSKPKRSKSLNQLDTDDDADDDRSAGKPKPKPKPRPRKSTSALDEKSKSASMENLGEEHNQYYPQSEGFVPLHLPPGYTAGVHPGYPGPPGMQAPYPYHMQGVPAGYPPNMYPPPPQQQPPVLNGNLPTNQPVPRKQKKSNWELLCEMTEGDRPRDDVTETGSVASSVFVSDPTSVQGYGPQMGNQPYYNQQTYYQPQTQQYPAFNQQHPGSNYDLNTAQNQRVPVPKLQEQPMNKQSSWEALKEITGSQGHVSAKPAHQKVNARTESVV